MIVGPGMIMIVVVEEVGGAMIMVEEGVGMGTTIAEAGEGTTGADTEEITEDEVEMTVVVVVGTDATTAEAAKAAEREAAESLKALGRPEGGVLHPRIRFPSPSASVNSPRGMSSPPGSRTIRASRPR